jgi:molybdate transport system permease protein
MPLKKLIQIIMELPLSLPYLVLGLCLLIVFSSDLGRSLRELGFKVVFDKNGIILAQLIVNLPFAIRFMRTAMSEIDVRLEFIAGTLGASRWTRFRTILLPLCRQSLIAMVILVWSRALGEFGATLMLVGVTRMKTETLPSSIYLNISTGDNGMAMASAILILIISAISLTVTTFLSRKSKPLTRMRDTTI